MGITLTFEDLNKANEAIGTAGAIAGAGQEDDFQKIERMLGTVNGILGQLGNLHANPVLRALIEKKMGVKMGGEASSNESTTVDWNKKKNEALGVREPTAEEVYEELVSLLIMIKEKFGDMQLSALILQFKTNKAIVIQEIKKKQDERSHLPAKTTEETPKEEPKKES